MTARHLSTWWWQKVYPCYGLLCESVEQYFLDFTKSISLLWPTLWLCRKVFPWLDKKYFLVKAYFVNISKSISLTWQKGLPCYGLFCEYLEKYFLYLTKSISFLWPTKWICRKVFPWLVLQLLQHCIQFVLEKYRQSEKRCQIISRSISLQLHLSSSGSLLLMMRES